MKDQFGNSISTQSAGVRDYFDGAAELIRLYRGDPIAALDAALDADPNFCLGWAIRAAAIGTTTDKALLGEAERSLRAGAACAEGASQRERDHLAAARDWCEGRFLEAVSRWGRIAQDFPRDILALQFAHVGDFFLGQQHELRNRPIQALRAWKAGEIGHGAILGMAAFGLQENGDYARAEGFGREGVEADRRDGWAAHAVAHVCEMQGRSLEGAAFLEATADGWAPESGFAYHNWWHLALFALDHEDHKRALELFDAKVRPQQTDVVMEMLDASALLWRLKLLNVDVGDRFATLASSWERAMTDCYYSFNEIHALLAMLGAGRGREADCIVAALRERAESDDENGLMTRQVALPLAQALMAFDAERYGEAADALHHVRGRAQRFGGSHAQRDIISLTLFEAAMRAGRREQAQALAAERIAFKPESAWARTLYRRAKAEQRQAA
ncbi:MAG: tetratricopeptide repeat protein [Hyphomonadaceae bacterium]|nr:tetratricopeptide repeat protein [Hyphomonadaceae bacterium]